MKKMLTFFFLGLLLVISQPLTAQETKAEAEKFDAQVIRSADGTHAQLSWPALSEQTIYAVELVNTKNKNARTYRTDQTSMKVFLLDVPATYEWRVYPQEIEFLCSFYAGIYYPKKADRPCQKLMNPFLP